MSLTTLSLCMPAHTCLHPALPLHPKHASMHGAAPFVQALAQARLRPTDKSLLVSQSEPERLPRQLSPAAAAAYAAGVEALLSHETALQLNVGPGCASCAPCLACI